jgi:mannose-6-phosphate isomerase-like protein (cupin superfamily)
MVYKGKILKNKKTGQTLEFVTTSAESAGSAIEIISTFPIKAQKAPPLHYHPIQDEHFEVISGELTLRIDNEVCYLRKGEKIFIPKKTKHSMWNEAGKPAVVNWIITPALKTEEFFENIIGTTEDQETDDSGVPSILQVSLFAQAFSKEFRLASPAYIIQKVLFTCLAPVAYIAGYRKKYKKYTN